MFAFRCYELLGVGGISQHDSDYHSKSSFYPTLQREKAGKTIYAAIYSFHVLYEGNTCRDILFNYQGVFLYSEVYHINHARYDNDVQVFST